LKSASLTREIYQLIDSRTRRRDKHFNLLRPEVAGAKSICQLGVAQLGKQIAGPLCLAHDLRRPQIMG
jgi:hypothetical protein